MPLFCVLAPEPIRPRMAGMGIRALALELALSRADFFLCASPEQRLFYAGALFACGRIGSEFAEDPSLERLLAVVPFGTPSEAASGDRVAGRRAAGVAPDGPLVLFGGV